MKQTELKYSVGDVFVTPTHELKISEITHSHVIMEDGQRCYINIVNQMIEKGQITIK